MYLIVVRLRFNSPASVTITYSFQAGDRSFACRGDGGITGCVCVCVCGTKGLLATLSIFFQHNYLFRTIRLCKLSQEHAKCASLGRASQIGVALRSRIYVKRHAHRRRERRLDPPGCAER